MIHKRSIPIYSTYNTLNHLKNKASLSYKQKIYECSHLIFDDKNKTKLNNKNSLIELTRYDLRLQVLPAKARFWWDCCPVGSVAEYEVEPGPL